MKKTLTAGLLLAASLAGTQVRAMPAIYLLGGIDGKMLTNTDANNYFNVNSVLGPKGYGSGVAHLGLQLGRYLAVEASVNGGLDRTNDVTYYNFGFPTRHVVTDWKLTTYSITPGLTWASPRTVNMLGFRIGQANLAGHVEDDAYGANGSYDQNAQVPDYGLLFRTSTLVADHFSVGLEFGYDWTVFNSIGTKNGSGTYDPPQNPDRNISNAGHNGDQTTLDFSGGHIALVIGLWTNPAVPEEKSSSTQE